MRTSFGRLTLLSTLAWLGGPAFATTIHVPADYPTVLAALDAAVAGDVVELAPGEYTHSETRSGRTSVGFLKAGITLQSSVGAAATTLRLLTAPSGSERATLTFDASGAVVIRGLRLTGEVSGMFGLQADHNFLGSNSITMEDCIVENLPGDGLRVVDWGVEGGNVTIRRCMFRNLVGAGYVNIEATLLEDSEFSDCAYGFAANTMSFAARRCNFIRNGWAAAGASAIQRSGVFEDCRFVESAEAFITGDPGSEVRIRGCVFYRTAIEVVVGGQCVVSNNTFYGDTVTAPLLELFRIPGIEPMMLHNIFANAGAGATAFVAPDPVQSECNVFWANPGGNVIGGLIGPADFVVDPLFCDPAVHDLRLFEHSPCLPPNSPTCGWVGALGEGCGIVSLEPTSWGRIKAGYRDGMTR